MFNFGSAGLLHVGDSNFGRGATYKLVDRKARKQETNGIFYRKRLSNIMSNSVSKFSLVWTNIKISYHNLNLIKYSISSRFTPSSHRAEAFHSLLNDSDRLFIFYSSYLPFEIVDLLWFFIWNTRWLAFLCVVSCGEPRIAFPRRMNETISLRSQSH